MKKILMISILLPVLLILCAPVLPSLYTIESFRGPETAKIVTVVSSVLQKQKFTISKASEEEGIVKTDWKDETDTASKVVVVYFRKRISVTINKITGQMRLEVIKQKALRQGQWRNINLSPRDEREVQAIISIIKAELT